MLPWHLAISFLIGPRHVPELHDVLDTTGFATSMWVQFMFLDEACMYYILVVA